MSRRVQSPIPAELLPDGLFVLDLVLNHDVTPLMRAAEARGRHGRQRPAFVPGRVGGDLQAAHRPGGPCRRDALARWPPSWGCRWNGSPWSATEGPMFYTSGWVHVICGCMFCGKTDEMLRLLRRFSIAGRRVVLIKPRLDTRTDALTVVSRSGAQHTAAHRRGLGRDREAGRRGRYRGHRGGPVLR